MIKKVCWIGFVVSFLFTTALSLMAIWTDHHRNLSIHLWEMAGVFVAITIITMLALLTVVLDENDERAAECEGE